VKTRAEAVHEWLAQIHAMLPPTEHRPVIGMVYDDEAKHVRWMLPDSLPTVEILQLTDVQFGHKCCQVRRVVEYRDWLLAAPNRFCVWTGDMVDLWTPASPGAPSDYTILPNERQLREFLKLMAPMRHRVLGYVGGNHERRMVPFFGDFGRLIAAALQIPYSGGRQHIDVYYGQHRPFRLSLWHGRGAARTKGTIAQTLARFIEQGDSQVYLMGHLHQPLILPVWKERRKTRGLGMELHKCIGAVGSSFLETYGSYAEVGGFSVSDVLMPRVVLEPNGKWEMTLR
jgi:hypothetical protein